MSLDPIYPCCIITVRKILLLLSMRVLRCYSIQRRGHAIGFQLLKGPAAGQLRHQKRPWELGLASA